MSLRKILCIMAFAVTHSADVADGQQTQIASDRPVPLYDPDPQHLWNRLHAELWDRVGPDGIVYGHDRVDPLLWQGTQHLLLEPSRSAALKVLQEFLDTHGETLIDEPVKRAVLQRDLCAIFDWLVGPHRDDHHRSFGEESKSVLRRPLAEVIGRLALDADVIAKLPNNFADAIASRQFAAAYDPAQPRTSFLPGELFDPDGPWVCLGRNGSDIIVPAHAESFSRSSFQVFLNLPAGRQATKDYVSELSSFKEPFRLDPLSDGRFVKRSNPNLPQLPAGTQVALVRSALLIDSDLHLRATHLVESVQLRVYRALDSQENYEFALSRARLFAGTTGGLDAVGIDDRDFVTDLNPHLHDEIESAMKEKYDPARRRGIVRHRCVGCHENPGVHSFRTFVGGFSPPELLPSFTDAGSTHRGETAAVRHKETRYDWGLLEGLLSQTCEPVHRIR